MIEGDVSEIFAFMMTTEQCLIGFQTVESLKLDKKDQKESILPNSCKSSVAYKICI